MVPILHKRRRYRGRKKKKGFGGGPHTVVLVCAGDPSALSPKEGSLVCLPFQNESNDIYSDDATHNKAGVAFAFVFVVVVVEVVVLDGLWVVVGKVTMGT
jgi:hypothetical protein